MHFSRWSRYITVVSHVALITIIAVRSGGGPSILLALPLLFPLPGLLRGRDYTYAWSTMLLVFYVGGYLSASYTNPAEKWTCIGIAALAALEFVSLSVYVKARSRERAYLKAMAAQAPSEQKAP